MYPQELFAYHKRPFWPVLWLKRIGLPCCTFLLLSLLARYKLSCYQTTLLLTISAIADITLLKTTCHLLLLLVGIDTLTYQKELQLIPYTCGSSVIQHRKGLASNVTNNLVTRSCITERVKRLVGNEIEVGMEIPTIESRAINTSTDEGNCI